MEVIVDEDGVLVPGFGLMIVWSMRLLAALMLIAILLPSAMAGEDDQDQVRKLRQQGKILPLSAIVERLSAKHPGRVIEVELEDEGGRRVYEIEMIETGGVLRTFHVDAHSGEILLHQQEE